MKKMMQENWNPSLRSFNLYFLRHIHATPRYDDIFIDALTRQVSPHYKKLYRIFTNDAAAKQRAQLQTPIGYKNYWKAWTFNLKRQEKSQKIGTGI
ncbi:unnamed protein product [Paramecium sonneborni]|uniref:Uncharacterized protein n=1 Tax=Paramecium sonneborni TaxID=65129 RepID=A0A8S1RS67_9CILI|nr:unnamed protein product [Paramecium sonneborni]